ncbi:MAG TPA: sigma-70 family RNA polymerase sigma factor [Puia sp.]|nr:sigma-70 family RNA polymerase sigma factor [Puia sp.]
MLSKVPDIATNELRRLIEGSAAGDRPCQKLLYEWYSPKMMMLCLRYARNTEEAEEILQDGFLQMYRHIRQYKFIGSFGSWLRKIMINCALMRYRSKEMLTRVIPLTPDHDPPAAEEDYLDRLGEQELIRMIQRLPPAYRMVFNLYVFEGLKHREIAELLRISEGTSKSNLWDARALLRQALAGKLKVAK